MVERLSEEIGAKALITVAWYLSKPLQSRGMIRVQEQDFDIGAEMNRITAGRTDLGAIVTFTGTVRDQAADTKIDEMTLEHYPGMTEAELERVEAKALARWPLRASLIIHRYGRLVPGDRIVLVITASAHRSAAFEAAEFLMDYLKTNAPFWKREVTRGGGRWVEAAARDEAAAGRWTEASKAAE